MIRPVHGCCRLVGVVLASREKVVGDGGAQPWTAGYREHSRTIKDTAPTSRRQLSIIMVFLLRVVGCTVLVRSRYAAGVDGGERNGGTADFLNIRVSKISVPHRPVRLLPPGVHAIDTFVLHTLTVMAKALNLLAQ